jgi:N-acetyl-anhydromuramyl-L-alanine amidase AmpD
VINGANGRTFGQLMLDFSGVPVAAVAPTPAGATATPTGAATEADPLARLLSFCRKNPEATGADWYAALQARAFPSDLSTGALKQLEMGVTVQPSCNVLPGNTPRAIVLHYTDGALDASLSEFKTPHKTSSHYLIDRDGSVYQVVPEKMMAFHVSCYGDRSTCLPSCPICENDAGRFKEPYEQSIGIELVNNGSVAPGSFLGDIYEDYSNAFGYRYWEDYPAAQLESLKVLVADIRARWDIPWEMVLGHSRVNTKPDPGPALNLFWPRYGNPPRAPIFDNTRP